MPITLVEVGKEIAQAASAIDCYLNEAYRARVLADFDNGTPEVDMLGVSVPRATLRDQDSLAADKVVIELESDCGLYARRDSGHRPDHQPGPAAGPGWREEMQGAMQEEMECESEYDIVVTLRNGLDPTASRLKIHCEFTRRGAPEGVAKATDQLAQEI